MRPALNFLSPASMAQMDSEIARAVLHSLDWDFFMPEGWVQASVSGGVVTLQGRVKYRREWSAIHRAIAKIRGVHEVRLPRFLDIEQARTSAESTPVGELND